MLQVVRLIDYKLILGTYIFEKDRVVYVKNRISVLPYRKVITNERQRKKKHTVQDTGRAISTNKQIVIGC